MEYTFHVRKIMGLLINNKHMFCNVISYFFMMCRTCRTHLNVGDPNFGGNMVEARSTLPTLLMASGGPGASLQPDREPDVG